MPSFCTILSNGCGAPYRRYDAKDAALGAAKGQAKRFDTEVIVAWCNDAGTAKLWLAHVQPDGAVRYTDSWPVT